MRALSIRQPYAELILRGIKTVELRSINTTILGERFYIYACKAKASPPGIWSADLQAATPPGCSGGLLAWHVDSQQIALHGFESGNALNAGPIHGLELLQADARGNLDANPNIPCTPPAAGCADRGDVEGDRQ